MLIGHDEDLAVRLDLHVDGSQPVSADLVAAVNAFSDRVEDAPGPVTAVVHVGGSPAHPVALDVKLVNRWERALRRLERLNAVTIGVATGDCGGVAAELLLTTDYRLATTDMRLLVPVDAGAVWPGMALYRLVNQIGIAKVRRAALFGGAIPAAQAAALDVVDEVVGDPVVAVAVAVATIGACTDPDLAMRRQLMLDATTTSFEEALGRHLAACDRTIKRVQEARAGVLAAG
jgi:isomerase DpgB